MNIGFISTRLAGTDGVSLETAKLAAVLRQMGHRIFYCAGELDENLPGLEAPELHFTDPTAAALAARAFGDDPGPGYLWADIMAHAMALKAPVHRFVRDFQIQFLIVQNAFAIPMQLPLAPALAQILLETRLPALAHNHDFYWERERFRHNHIRDFLEAYFPPELPKLRHAVINSAAGRELKARRGLDSVFIPNVMDFATLAPGIDDYNADFRGAIGLSDDDWLILQPTRVIPRKGIELSIELVARLNDPRAKLVITHHAGDEGLDYLRRLQETAVTQGVDLRYVTDRVDDSRRAGEDGRKIYALWDAYPHADLVAYPSLYEGFGNALIETIYFRKPALVNRYGVYAEDIGPRGFRFAEIDGAVTAEAVDTVKNWLTHPETARASVEHNFRLGQQHFSHETLARLLAPLLES